MERIVDELVSNAWDHANTQVTVEVFSRDGLAVLQVSDDGVGIPEAERELVFDRFVRGPPRAQAARASAWQWCESPPGQTAARHRFFPRRSAPRSKCTGRSRVACRWSRGSPGRLCSIADLNAASVNRSELVRQACGENSRGIEFGHRSAQRLRRLVGNSTPVTPGRTMSTAPALCRRRVTGVPQALRFDCCDPEVLLGCVHACPRPPHQ